MLGMKTTAAIRQAAERTVIVAADAAEELSTLRRDVSDVMESYKTAGQRASVAFGAVAIVAVVALLVAAFAVAHIPRKG